MDINILTTFPEFTDKIKDYSMIKRAISQGIVNINSINIRDFSNDPNNRTDDYPYGGGNGMLMTCQPIYDALSSIENRGKVIYMSPHGRTLTQSILNDLSKLSVITILCGHYEGVDARIIDNYVDLELSVGDYVLTGGELPAMILIDGVSRLLPGFLKSEDSFKEESFYHGLLEHPQYTRPFEFNGYKVPEILLSGDHQKVFKYNLMESIKLTKKLRPDLIEKLDLAQFNDKEIIEFIIKMKEGGYDERYWCIEPRTAKERHSWI